MFYRAKWLKDRRGNAEDGFEDGFRAWTVDFDVRKFPQMSVHDPGGPLADQETAFSLDHKGNELSRGGGGAFAEIGQFSARSSRNATHSFFTGQILHCGFRGVQIRAPSSMRD